METLGRLLAAEGDSLEALEFAEGLLDTGPPAIEAFGKNVGLFLAFD